jgi:hypothetical protein
MRTLALSLMCLVLAAGVAGATVYKSQTAKVSIDIPKGWQVDAKDDLVRAASANNEVALIMLVVDTPDVKEALTRLEGELYSSIKNLKWVDKTKKLTVNKLAGTWVEGVGVSSRATSLDVVVFVAGTPTKKGVILFAVVDHDKYEANRRAIQSIFGTLKPTK